MCHEIGEILGKLKEDHVIDFEKNMPIILRDRSEAYIDFERSDVLKVKRFTSLVNNHLHALTYLCRNLTHENKTVEVERNDRIMGAINYGKTFLLRQRSHAKKSNVVCSEIFKTFDTPENRLLALILFSILMYCDRYLKLERMIDSADRFGPTRKELRSIRSYVSNLLSMQAIRKILPAAIESRRQFNILLRLVLKRIQEGKIPVYFKKIPMLYSQWKYYISITFSDEEVAKDVLQYHFMRIENLNDLYECWVFCKILYTITERYDLKFKESRSTEGLATYKSHRDEFKIIYQASYATTLTDIDDETQSVVDRPDILIKFRNGTTVIIDAKNSIYKMHSDSRPNIDQMRSYMTTIKPKYGIFVHSKSEIPNLWRGVKDNLTKQEIYWTSLVPKVGNTGNEKCLENVMSRLQKISISGN